MSRVTTLEPRWLIGLLTQWALKSLHEQSHSLGWYATSPMLADGIPSRVRSYEPTGYGDSDFKDVDRAFAQLPVMRRLAVLRYFKPWGAAAIEAEVKRDTETWMRHLKLALRDLQGELDRKKVPCG